MFEHIEELKQQLLQELDEAISEEALEKLRIKYLGKKGAIRGLMKQMKKIDPSQRRDFGKKVNEMKTFAEESLEQAVCRLADLAIQEELKDERFDPSRPGVRPRAGTFHPLRLVRTKLVELFRSMGFYILDYPEMELEFYNFEALNIPGDHPARDMQDTFWMEEGLLLRTHTSSGQTRAMKHFKPPFKAIFPGKVYRYEELDASHEHTFHQLEGLYIDRDVSVANLISSMKTLLLGIFQREVTIRLRPGYFPFVEPGFELDIRCMVCGGDGCSVCKQSGWVELLPCGLVHPNVIRYGGLDPEEWSGWAFGLGLSRLVMMKYQIDDIRLLMGGDLRFMGQFNEVV